MEKRQGYCCPSATQECSAGQVLLRDDHELLLCFPCSSLRNRICCAIIIQFCSHLERRVLDNSQDDRFHCVVVFGRALHNVSYDGHIHGFESAAQSVDHQLLGNRTDENLRPVCQCLAQRNWTIDSRAVGKNAG